MGKRRFSWMDAAKVALVMLLATALGYLFAFVGFPETNIVLVYLAAVLLIARYTHGPGYALAASVLATFAFNYFFTEPRFTFEVSDTSYLITFAIMMFTAIFTSTLTAQMKRSARRALARERDTQALYQLTNHLSDAQSMEAIGTAALGSIGQTFGCDAALLFLTEKGEAERSYLQYAAGNIMHRELCASDEVASRVQLLHTGCVETEAGQEWPLYGQQRILGVLRLPRMALSDAQRQLLCSMLESISMAIERLSAAQAQHRYREESFQERTRSNLLRAISHDLRTPLSGIMGTSEMIRDLSAQDDPRRRLAQDIWRDADWLRALVENILSLTRLEDGRLQIEKQPEAVEEIVGSALAQMERRAPDREIDAELPEELLMVPMDAKLIVQMLVNLLDNAVRHTPPGNEIKVCVEKRDGKAVFSVLDRGEGIREEDLPHLFERFYTTRGKSADAARGVGLGLSICDAIARAHGGSIRAQSREGGGAIFTFELPMEEEKP